MVGETVIKMGILSRSVTEKSKMLEAYPSQEVEVELFPFQQQTCLRGSRFYFICRL